jgi:hypothetical protein
MTGGEDRPDTVSSPPLRQLRGSVIPSSSKCDATIGGAGHFVRLSYAAWDSRMPRWRSRSVSDVNVDIRVTCPSAKQATNVGPTRSLLISSGFDTR